jgi:twitching motility protein PilT
MDYSSLLELIQIARQAGASDIHLSSGSECKAMLRIDGSLKPAGLSLTEDETEKVLLSLLEGSKKAAYSNGRDTDFTLETPDGLRQRVNIYSQLGKPAASIRLIPASVPDFNALGLPKALETLSELTGGLILVTGLAGSGKSTTLAAIVERVNSVRPAHIITVEDPIEYVYRPKLSLIHQREVGRDTEGFASAIRSALREDPDIILVGEMRDSETISAVLTAAETGHLVLSSLHTARAHLAVDRIIDSLPPSFHNQARSQLAGTLKGVICQRLIPAIGGGRVAAAEVLTGTDAVLNMIRDNRPHQLLSVMQAGAREGMHTLNADLARLVRSGKITKENALKHSPDRKELEELL